MADGALVDTTVLISAVDVARADHALCLDLLARHPALHLCAQVCREFLAVATRPTAANGLGQSTEHACENLERIRRRLPLVPEERPIFPTLFHLVKTYGLSGRGIHDAGLVAAAKVHRLPRLITTDRQIFIRYADEIAIQSPAEAMS